jgi:acetolactate synthase I/II/III large subunit
VEYVFGVPGEENLELLEALRNSHIRFVVTRHEQAAGFMAATYGRLTGKPGVALSTLGPGATNLVTAAAFAQLGGMPLLLITGQKPIMNRKQGNFQIVSVVDMMQPLTKFTRQVVAAETIPALVREAFRRAQEERPGACHLELPQDVASDEVDVPLLGKSRTRRPIADDKAITYAAEALRASKHPLLMIGAGANRKLTSKTLRGFIEKLAIPFFTTQMGKGVLDESHDLWLGNAALSAQDFVHRAIEASDCIVNVGHDVVEKPPFLMRGSERTVIHLNYQSAEVDTVYFPQIEVVGDIANAVWRLTEALTPQAHWDFSFFGRVRAAQLTQLEERARDEHFPLYAQRVVADVRRAMGAEDIVCLDNGLYKLWFARNYRCPLPNTLLLDNALASMGAGLATAIAARLVYPERKVLAVCGDGGFMMNSQELETAVRLGIDLTVLVLRDDAYGMIEWKQRHEKFARFGIELGNPDFVAYAQSYGARGHRPSTAGELSSLLERALVSPGIDVIDVQVDYRDDDRILNQHIPALSKAVR